MTSSKDSAAVRAGEELDLAVLDRYLREQLSARSLEFDPISTIEIEQFPGGHSNLTYLIRYGAREFVLRRPPVGPVAPTAHDMPREYKLLSIIHTQFPLAPKPILLCEDVSIIGVPFYLMERRRGFIVRFKVPEQIGDDLGLRRRLSEAVVDTLCTVGDPLIDVGLLLTYWTMNAGASTGGNAEDKNGSLRAVTNGPGWMTREEIIERYQSKTGMNLSGIVFYETFARFKVAVVIQQIYFRYVKGQTHDERFRNFDRLVLELAREALSWHNAQGFEPPRHQERQESKKRKQINLLAQFDNY